MPIAVDATHATALLHGVTGSTPRRGTQQDLWCTPTGFRARLTIAPLVAQLVRDRLDVRLIEEILRNRHCPIRTVEPDVPYWLSRAAAPARLLVLAGRRLVVAVNDLYALGLNLLGVSGRAADHQSLIVWLPAFGESRCLRGRDEVLVRRSRWQVEGIARRCVSASSQNEDDENREREIPHDATTLVDHRSRSSEK